MDIYILVNIQIEPLDFANRFPTVAAAVSQNIANDVLDKLVMVLLDMNH